MLGIYNSIAFSTSSGLALAPGATIEVRRIDTNALATLWQDEAGTISQSNPFNADAVTGAFQFYALGIARGYSVKSTYLGNSITLLNQRTGTAGALDFGATGAAVLAAADAVTAMTAMDAYRRFILAERPARRARLFAALNFC